MGTEVSKVKQILRGQMRQALAELSDQERAWSDGELIQRFLDHPKLAQAQTVMLYYGVGHEIRTEGLIQTLLDQGKTVCLPKCLPETRWRPGSSPAWRTWLLTGMPSPPPRTPARWWSGRSWT